ncbi:hypothetical protein [Streptomyces sp. S.PB5]|uniref:hypothetical protein n=1 Tax=Streptomyces sp. S.PB5 TaxID=3020844 RepID=UPI0025B1EB71|nr:hypothetical protein [Streptomyces sp. S.PB5]MDN3029683.1 hypothetical protein [Streptomyces sp. S.PB5]
MPRGWQVLRNLHTLLASQGLDFSDVIKVTAHLANLYRNAVPRPLHRQYGT